MELILRIIIALIGDLADFMREPVWSIQPQLGTPVTVLDLGGQRYGWVSPIKPKTEIVKRRLLRLRVVWQSARDSNNPQ